MLSMMAGDSSSGDHTLQYDGTIRATALQLLGMLDEPCVVSWSWQTRALRRAAGNCVLYTYTIKDTLHTDGGSYRGRRHSRASTGTDTLTQAVGLDSWTEGDPEGYLSCAGVSAAALHGIDAGGTCKPLISGRDVSERRIALLLASGVVVFLEAAKEAAIDTANIKASFCQVGDPPRQSESDGPTLAGEVCVKATHLV